MAKSAKSQLSAVTKYKYLQLAFKLAVIATFTVFSIALWLPTRYLPYHGDAAGFVVPASQNLLATGYTPLIAKGSDFSHPPLFILLHTVAWQIFGLGPITGHYLMLPFLPILVISSFFFSRAFVGRLPALLAALLVAISPVVLAEYGNIYLDLPAAAMATLALALWVNGFQFLGIFTLVFAGLMKGTVLFLLPFFMLYPVYPARTKEYLRQLAWVVIPLAIYGLWLIYHFSQTGWWFIAPGRSGLMPTNIVGVLSSITYVFLRNLLSNGRWIITLLTFVGLVYLIARKSVKALLPVISVIISILSSMLIFAFSGTFALRYALFLLPLMLLLFVWTLWNVAKTRQIAGWKIAIIPLLIIPYFIFLWHPKTTTTVEYEFRNPIDLSYMDVTFVMRSLGAFTQLVAPEASYYGGFPENVYLTNPVVGYVNQPVKFTLCRDFTLDDKKRQILILHAHSPEQENCRRLLDVLVVNPLDRYERNGKWIELYEVNASASATINEK